MSRTPWFSFDTALYYLVLVRYLVEQGADKNKPTNKGSTLLGAARFFGNAAVAAYLQAAGAR